MFECRLILVTIPSLETCRGNRDEQRATPAEHRTRNDSREREITMGKILPDSYRYYWRYWTWRDVFQSFLVHHLASWRFHVAYPTNRSIADSQYVSVRCISRVAPEVAEYSANVEWVGSSNQPNVACLAPLCVHRSIKRMIHHSNDSNESYLQIGVEAWIVLFKRVNSFNGFIVEFRIGLIDA